MNSNQWSVVSGQPHPEGIPLGKACLSEGILWIGIGGGVLRGVLSLGSRGPLRRGGTK